MGSGTRLPPGPPVSRLPCKTRPKRNLPNRGTTSSRDRSSHHCSPGSTVRNGVQNPQNHSTFRRSPTVYISSGISVAHQRHVESKAEKTLDHHARPTRRRRRIRRNRTFTARVASFSLVCTVLLVLIAVVAAWENFEVPVPQVAPPALVVDGGTIPEVNRPVYRYSVVDGGVYSPEELPEAILDDRVVAEHYREIALDAVRTETVTEPRLVYMSYRKGGEIYWAKHKVALPAGETILTDGVTEIRARCGNCISTTPMGPTSEQEPELIAFEETTAPVDPASGSPTETATPLAHAAVPSLVNQMLAAVSDPGWNTRLPGELATIGGITPLGANTALLSGSDDPFPLLVLEGFPPVDADPDGPGGSDDPGPDPF